MITTLERRTNQLSTPCEGRAVATTMPRRWGPGLEGVRSRTTPEVAPRERIGVDYPDRGDATTSHAIRILIVDGDCDFTLGMSSLLRRRGHWVQFAHTGAVALNVARAFQPEFVLVDAWLPDVSGYKVAALLPGVVSAGLRIASISEECDEENLRFSRAAGCVFHLGRPVDLGDIEAVLSGRGWDAGPQ